MNNLLPRIEYRVDQIIGKARLAISQMTYGERYTERVFSEIYSENAWSDPFSRSGTGSNREQTAVIRREIPRMLKQFGVQTLLDIPCGDFWWMRETKLPEEIQYTGADIVGALIDSNARQFGNSRISFVKLNLIEDPLPKADLVLCRDCLVHLSFADINRAIGNLKRSGSTYLLTTHFAGETRKNVDIATGEWRTLNLAKAPLYFPEPLYVLNERSTERNGAYQDKSLALYRIADLPVSY